MTGTGPKNRGTTSSDIRSADRWLIGLVLFLIALVVVAGYLGWTALSRQSRATCYQLRAIEAAQLAERKLADTDGRENRKIHLARAESSRVYAAGLRAIVPGCPHSPPLITAG